MRAWIIFTLLLVAGVVVLVRIRKEPVKSKDVKTDITTRTIVTGFDEEGNPLYVTTNY